MQFNAIFNVTALEKTQMLVNKARILRIKGTENFIKLVLKGLIYTEKDREREKQNDYYFFIK